MSLMGWINCPGIAFSAVQTVAPVEGSTDDTPRIQTALNEARGGGTVYFKAGTYLVRGAVVWENTTLQGEPGAVLMLPGDPTYDQTNNFPILEVRSSGDMVGTTSTITMKGLTFDGNKDQQLGGPSDSHFRDGMADAFDSGCSNGCGRAYRPAIRADASTKASTIPYIISKLIVEGCHFKDTYGAGVAARAVPSVTLRNNTAENLNFELGMIYSPSYINPDSPTDNSGSVFIQGNWVDGINSYATEEQAKSNPGSTNGDAFIIKKPAFASIIGNTVSRVARCLVKIEGGGDVNVSNNTQFRSLDRYAGIQAVEIVNRLSIVGNNINDTGTGIMVSGPVNQGVIRNNVIDGTFAEDGIQLTGLIADLDIEDNTLLKVQRHGIYYISRGNRVRLLRNKVTGRGISGSRGIFIEAAGQVVNNFSDTVRKRIVISNNHVSDFTENIYLQRFSDSSQPSILSGTFENLEITNNKVLGYDSTTPGIFFLNSNWVESGIVAGNYIKGTLTKNQRNITFRDNLINTE